MRRPRARRRAREPGPRRARPPERELQRPRARAYHDGRLAPPHALPRAAERGDAARRGRAVPAAAVEGGGRSAVRTRALSDDR